MGELDTGVLAISANLRRSIDVEIHCGNGFVVSFVVRGLVFLVICGGITGMCGLSSGDGLFRDAIRCLERSQEVMIIAKVKE